MGADQPSTRRALLATVGTAIGSIAATGAASGHSIDTDIEIDQSDPPGRPEGIGGDIQQPRVPQTEIDNGIVFLFYDCTRLRVSGDLRDVSHITVGVDYEAPGSDAPGFDSLYFEVESNGTWSHDLSEENYTTPVVTSAAALEGFAGPSVAGAQNPHREACSPW